MFELVIWRLVQIAWWFEFVVLDGFGGFGFCVLLGCLCVVFIVGLFGGVAIAVKYF